MHLYSLAPVVKPIGHFIATMPPLFSIRNAFRLSVALKKFPHGNGVYALAFYGTPSPARFLSCASWRDLSFTAAFIFYLPAFTLYLPLIPTSLLHLSHSQYGGDFFWRIAHGFHKSLPRLDMTFLRIEIISFQGNNYPSFSSHLFRKKTPQITTKYKIRSSFISK